MFLKRLQDLCYRLLPVGSFRRDLYWNVLRTAEVLCDDGAKGLFRKVLYRLRLSFSGQNILLRAPGGEGLPTRDSQYGSWLQQHRLKPADLEWMRMEVPNFTYHPLLSILTPVHNTEEVWLRRTIESVQQQIYSNWELCIVNDASTKPHVKTILDEYAASDPRVRLNHLSRRQGITGASSEALAMAKGDFVGFLDHDDEITADALWQVVSCLNRNPETDLVYSDEDKLKTNGTHVAPFFKPDWSPNLLLSMNYITHFTVFRKSVVKAIGGFRVGYEGAQDYDLLLRFTERTSNIAHIPKILYHWRMVNTSFAYSASAKPFATESGRRAIQDALQRRGCEASVQIVSPGRYAARYKIQKPELTTIIIIPTKKNLRLLERCVSSIEETTRYQPYEIIIVHSDMNRTRCDSETGQQLDVWSSRYRVFCYRGSFNFSAISNFAAGRANGEYLVFLNGNTQVLSPEWLTSMVEQAQRPEIGAVGAKILDPNNRIEHAGIVLGILGEAGHAFRKLPDNRTAYFGFPDVIRDCSAVTADCMMVPRKAFDDIGGFDERLEAAYNDIDFCLRLRKRGYLIVYTPLAVLCYSEFAVQDRLGTAEEEKLFHQRWNEITKSGDPYYNPNLTITREDWSLKIDL